MATKNAQAVKKHYDTHAHEIGERKLYKRITEKGVMPTPQAIAKYGVRIVDDEIVLPHKYRRDEPVSADQVVEFLRDKFSDANPSTIDKMSAIRQVLQKAGADLSDVRKYEDDLLEMIKKHYDTPNARIEKMRYVLMALQNHPTFSKVSVPEMEKALQEEKGTQEKGIETQKQDQKVYDWENILETIEKKYGKYSPENLFFRLYDEVPIRNDFYKPENVLEKDRFILKNHKTKHEQVYNLSPELQDLIAKVPTDFLRKKNLGEFVQGVLESSGYENFPYGKKDTRRDTWNGLRNTVITYRNSVRNTGSKPKGVELAHKMNHSGATSKFNYTHEAFHSSGGS